MDTTEYFDVVNRDDQVIDRQPRGIVHRDDLLHRSVHALVYDSRHRLYLQKRAMNKDTNPGLWDTSMGGHLESGESYDQALVRETREELGIEVKVIPPRLFKLEPSADTGYEFIQVYRIIHDGHIAHCKVEIEQGYWVDVGELRLWMLQQPDEFTSTLKLILGRLEPGTDQAASRA